jgi:hypothetical protein
MAFRQGHSSKIEADAETFLATEQSYQASKSRPQILH